MFGSEALELKTLISIFSAFCSSCAHYYCEELKQKLQWSGSGRFLSSPSAAMSNVISPSVNKRQTVHEIVSREKKKELKVVAGCSRWDLSQEVGKVMHPETSWGNVLGLTYSQMAPIFSALSPSLCFFKLIKGAVRTEKRLLRKTHGCNFALIVHFSL